MEIRNDIYLGDCKEQLTLLPVNSVDLIITSDIVPEYAEMVTKSLLYLKKKGINNA